MKTNSLSVRARAKSFGYAFQGIYRFFSGEPNAVLHLIATLLVFAAAVFFDASKMEIIALLIVTGFVWVTELLNTAIEKIMDHITPEKHPAVAFIKDVAAGAVLLAAFIALVTGALIFIPKII